MEDDKLSDDEGEHNEDKGDDERGAVLSRDRLASLLGAITSELPPMPAKVNDCWNNLK